MNSRSHVAAILAIPLAAFAAGLTFTTVDVPGPLGANGTFAQGNNEQGDVVGFTVDASGTGHGYLMSKKGSVTTIDFPGANAGTAARGINSSGDIVGEFSVDAATHGFLRSKHGELTQLDFPVPPGRPSRRESTTRARL